MKSIELRGVNHANKGAELMLKAILSHLREKHPSIIPAMPFRESNFAKRRGEGVGHLVYFQQERFSGMDKVVDLAVRCVPVSLRRQFGILSETEVDGALDASGFRYSDQWSAADLAHSVKRISTYRKRGKPFILLPQAFGPFRKPEYQGFVHDLVHSSTLIFARDIQSLEHLRSFAGNAPQLKLAPDFTNLISVDGLNDVDLPARSLVIVPNSRMLDKVSPEVAQSYLPFLLDVATAASANGLKPIVLVHDSAEDVALAKKLQSLVTFPISIVSDPDPVRLKAYLGKAEIVISSRFHAIVGALSLGVPTIALGWSHKYQELMSDYGMGNFSVKTTDKDFVVDAIKTWSEPSVRLTQHLSILESARTQKLLTLKMWQEVDDHLAKL